MSSPFPLRTGTQFFTITPGSRSIVGPPAADGRPIGYCDGFICDNDGTVAIVGKDSADVTPVTITVVKGYPYNFAVKLITSASGPTSIVGWI